MQIFCKSDRMVGKCFFTWVAYRGIIWCRLVGLAKCTGVRPIGIGDILRRLICKFLLVVVGKEATKACRTDQLSSGLEA